MPNVQVIERDTLDTRAEAAVVRDAVDLLREPQVRQDRRRASQPIAFPDRRAKTAGGHFLERRKSLDAIRFPDRRVSSERPILTTVPVAMPQGGLKIAFIGTKGVPSKHGGVERHVEELGSRLAAMGNDVTVFTRPHYTDRSLRWHRGMRLVSLPTVPSKHLDAIVHSVLASFLCWTGRFDIVHYHAVGPCLASPIARLRGRRIVATVHGQDWRRAKWGRLASTVLRLGEYLALRVPDATISVSRTLAARYLEEEGRTVDTVPNGVTVEAAEDLSVLDEFGLLDGDYVLFAGRLVPEKGVHYLLDAHASAATGLPLVIAGDTSASDDYVRTLRAAAGPGVLFAGYQYGARLATLFRHAALFVLPSDLEGLPLVLLEALAYGVPVLASDIPPNVEVLGDRGRYFRAGDTGDLAEALSRAVGDLGTMRSEAERMRQIAVREYDWDRVAAQTMQVYLRVMDARAVAGGVRARVRRAVRTLIEAGTTRADSFETREGAAT